MRTAALLGIAGLAAFITYCFRQGSAVRSVRAEARTDLNRWEGEGGSSSPRPDLASLPPPSIDGPYVRH